MEAVAAMESCAGCTSGPAGIAGHDQLFSHTMTAGEMQFRCRSCGESWVRRYRSDGSYAWESIDRTSGPDVPGRPGTAPP